jgi:hypothetical protein
MRTARAASAGWRFGVMGLIGALALALATASPAGAQTACTTSSGQVMVEFLGVGTNNTILMEQLDGAYQGDVRVRVYCGIDNQLVPNSVVRMSTTVPNSFVRTDASTNTWVAATEPAYAEVSLPSGEGIVSIKSPDPGLTGWKARVGASTVTVTNAFGQPLSGTGGYPTASGAIWAQTPELGSVALFGTGALGMAGFALLRWRARRQPSV